MIKFPSIEQFRNVIKNVTHTTRYDGQDEEGKAKFDHTRTLPKLRFRGTVKLHGTNAAIVKDREGNFTFQSRERVLSLESDNAGFYAFMANRIPGIDRMIEDILIEAGFDDTPHEVAVFGEWCGGNIQKGVAITGLPKMFVIFKVKVDGEWIDSQKIQYCEIECDQIFNILRFPYYNITVDFENPGEAQNRMIDMTMAVEAECPVGKAFGFEGVGEGIVWECVEPGYNDSGYWFKVKGSKHSMKSNVKTLAPVDVEAINSINEFVDEYVSENRLKQGIDKLVEMKLEVSMKSLGDFIRWVFNDIVKEEHDTIVENGFEVKKLGGPIANKARKWFITHYG